MRLFPNDKTYPTGVDAWGFPVIWVPFGKAGEVEHDYGIKQISYESLFVQDSLDTLAGKPVYYFHPGAVTPENFALNTKRMVGITSDVYRKSKDGLGGEVLVRISDLKVYKAIVNKKITCSSPGYSEVNGFRDYNHFAIIPPGYARGGDKMKIQLESQSAVEIYDGIDLNPEKLTTTENNPMETQIGEIIATSRIVLDEIKSLRSAVDEIVEESKQAKEASEAAPEDTTTQDEKEKTIFQEGYEEGLKAGAIISQAKAYGYDGACTTEAQAHVVKKAFPDITLEGYSQEYTTGLYTGALLALSRRAETQTPVTTAPAVIIQESKPGKVAARIPNGQS